MKRKRNQIEDNCNNNNDNKKHRLVEEESDIYQLEDNENNASLGEKKEEFVLTRELADNAILTDLSGRKWRIGEPVGKGSFGEIFLASNDTSLKVDVRNAQFVTKIEPHSNGPLFVEIHCLLNVNKHNDGK